MSVFSINIEAVIGELTRTGKRRFPQKDNYSYHCKIIQKSDGYQILISTFYKIKNDSKNGTSYFIDVAKKDFKAYELLKKLLKENNALQKSNSDSTLKQICLNGSLRAVLSSLKNINQNDLPYY